MYVIVCFMYNILCTLNKYHTISYISYPLHICYSNECEDWRVVSSAYDLTTDLVALVAVEDLGEEYRDEYRDRKNLSPSMGEGSGGGRVVKTKREFIQMVKDEDLGLKKRILAKQKEHTTLYPCDNNDTHINARGVSTKPHTTTSKTSASPSLDVGIKVVTDADDRATVKRQMNSQLKKRIRIYQHAHADHPRTTSPSHITSATSTSKPLPSSPGTTAVGDSSETEAYSPGKSPVVAKGDGKGRISEFVYLGTKPITEAEERKYSSGAAILPPLQPLPSSPLGTVLLGSATTTQSTSKSGIAQDLGHVSAHRKDRPVTNLWARDACLPKRRSSSFTDPIVLAYTSAAKAVGGSHHTGTRATGADENLWIPNATKRITDESGDKAYNPCSKKDEMDEGEDIYHTHMLTDENDQLSGVMSPSVAALSPPLVSPTTVSPTISVAIEGQSPGYREQDPGNNDVQPEKVSSPKSQTYDRLLSDSPPRMALTASTQEVADFMHIDDAGQNYDPSADHDRDLDDDLSVVLNTPHKRQRLIKNSMFSPFSSSYSPPAATQSATNTSSSSGHNNKRPLSSSPPPSASRHSPHSHSQSLHTSDTYTRLFPLSQTSPSPNKKHTTATTSTTAVEKVEEHDLMDSSDDDSNGHKGHKRLKRLSDSGKKDMPTVPTSKLISLSEDDDDLVDSDDSSDCGSSTSDGVVGNKRSKKVDETKRDKHLYRTSDPLLLLACEKVARGIEPSSPSPPASPPRQAVSKPRPATSSALSAVKSNASINNNNSSKDVNKTSKDAETAAALNSGKCASDAIALDSDDDIEEDDGGSFTSPAPTASKTVHKSITPFLNSGLTKPLAAESNLKSAQKEASGPLADAFKRATPGHRPPRMTPGLAARSATSTTAVVSTTSTSAAGFGSPFSPASDNNWGFQSSNHYKSLDEILAEAFDTQAKDGKFLPYSTPPTYYKPLLYLT